LKRLQATTKMGLLEGAVVKGQRPFREGTGVCVSFVRCEKKKGCMAYELWLHHVEAPSV